MKNYYKIHTKREVKEKKASNGASIHNYTTCLLIEIYPALRTISFVYVLVHDERRTLSFVHRTSRYNFKNTCYNPPSFAKRKIHIKLLYEHAIKKLTVTQPTTHTKMAEQTIIFL